MTKLSASMVAKKRKWHDLFWWSVVIIALSFGVWSVYVYQDVAAVWRAVGWVLGLSILTVCFLQTREGRKARTFVRQARRELQQIVWPTRQESVQMTMTVMLIVLLVALLLWGIDTFLMWLMHGLTG